MNTKILAMSQGFTEQEISDIADAFAAFNESQKASDPDHGISEKNTNGHKIESVLLQDLRNNERNDRVKHSNIISRIVYSKIVPVGIRLLEWLMKSTGITLFSKIYYKHLSAGNPGLELALLYYSKVASDRSIMRMIDTFMKAYARTSIEQRKEHWWKVNHEKIMEVRTEIYFDQKQYSKALTICNELILTNKMNYEMTYNHSIIQAQLTRDHDQLSEIARSLIEDTAPGHFFLPSTIYGVKLLMDNGLFNAQGTIHVLDRLNTMDLSDRIDQLSFIDYSARAHSNFLDSLQLFHGKKYAGTTIGLSSTTDGDRADLRSIFSSLTYLTSSLASNVWRQLYFNVIKKDLYMYQGDPLALAKDYKKNKYYLYEKALLFIIDRELLKYFN